MKRESRLKGRRNVEIGKCERGVRKEGNNSEGSNNVELKNKLCQSNESDSWYLGHLVEWFNIILNTKNYYFINRLLNIKIIHKGADYGNHF